MPSRRDVSTGLRPGVFTPAAAPVNRTVQPGPSPLRELAGSFAKTSDTLRRFSADTAEREKSKDVAQAEADVAQWAVRDNKKYTDAINEGLIPPGASPWYKYAAREAYGRLEATRLGTAMLGQVDEAVQNSNGTLSFDEFLAQHVAAVVPPTMDEAYRQGFYRNIEAQVYNARQRFASQTAAVTEASSINTMQAEMVESAQNIYMHGADGPMGMEGVTAGITMNLQSIARRYLAVNPRGGNAVNRATTEAITALAAAHEDPTLIETLGDSITLPNGTKLSSQTYFREAAERARNDIYRDGERKDRARDRQIAERIDTAYERVMEQNANGQPINWDAERVALGLSHREIDGVKDRFSRSGGAQDDPLLVAELTRGIIDGDGTITPRRIASAVGSGLSPSTAFSLASQLRTTTKYLNEMPSHWRRQLEAGAMDARRLVSATAANPLLMMSVADATKANELALQYRQEFLQFYGVNRDKTEVEITTWRNKWMTDHRNQVETVKPAAAAPTLSADEVNSLVNRLTVDLQDDVLSPEMDQELRRHRIPDSAKRDPKQVRSLLAPASPSPTN